MRTLGRTGERISALGLGGYYLGLPQDPRETARMIHAAIEGGLTCMDSSGDAFQGESERRMGEALRGYRDRVFLVSKIAGPTRQEAIAQMDQALKRLQTDHLDLLLLHDLRHPDDPDRVFAPGGAMDALVAAQQAGKIRYIGFSGHHDPAIHLKMLDMGFDFDAVQLPLNLLDAQTHAFEKAVLPLLVEREIGVLGMQPLAGGKLIEAGRIAVWDCLRYAMTLPTSTVVTAAQTLADVALAVRAMEEFAPMEPDEAEFFLKKAAPLAPAPRS